MRIIVKLEKKGTACYLSHLDLQRLLQRAFRRAQIPLAYSQGFNPHPLLSFAAALSVGDSSSAEWLEVRLDQPMDTEEFLKRANAMLPPGILLLSAEEAPEKMPTLSSLMAFAGYEVTLDLEQISVEQLDQAINELLQGEILVNKRSKSGEKLVDLRPMVHGISRSENQLGILDVVGTLNASGSLNIPLLMQKLLEMLGGGQVLHVHRYAIYSEQDCVLPQLPGQK